ncbi:MAG: dihydroorotate dehydrogenase electron transfer subunit [candidate division WOR-3 bacterium]
MIKHRIQILKKEWLSPNIFSIECDLPHINPTPGQFLQIQITDYFDPLLNRPISIADYDRGRLLMIIKVVGKGTRILAEKKVGDELIVFGPFGKRLNILDKKSLIIAGGIGVAPLYFLARKLQSRKIDFTFVYGARTPVELVLKKELQRITNKVIFITEKGSKKRGTAISVLQEIDLSKYEIGYACGPKPMLKELKAMDLKFPIYAFCEDFLGCGAGLCLGCAIEYYGVYKRICEDGPIFELKGLCLDNV